jgi:hypothetical protein
MKGIDRNTKCPKIRSYILAISTIFGNINVPNMRLADMAK